MLDRFVYGSVERISPEAPIPVLRVEREKSMLGGVGNVVANLAGLGAKVDLISVIGSDADGEQIRYLVQDIVRDDNGLVVDDQRPTTVKTRFISCNQQILRADFEKHDALSAGIKEELKERLVSSIEKVDVIILADYDKGVLSDGIASFIIDISNHKNKKVIVDPKGNDYSRYKGAFMVTPNRSELSGATGGSPIKTDDEVIFAANQIIQGWDINVVLATRSEDGMSIISSDAEPIHIPTVAQEVFDVSGAGDTVVATIATAISAGSDIKTAATMANITGGIVVGKIGTAVVRADEVQNILLNSDCVRESYMQKALSSLVSKESILDQVEKWRAQGLKVGFTNGCFDLLHPGHVSLLEQSRAKCDRLIVGLNTDQSIKRLKGEDRPVQDEMSRAIVLGAIGDVNSVVLFDEDTPIELIESISPDVLIKGGDYTIETVVGAEHVLSYGGEVFLASLEDGHSTTNTVKNMVA